MPPSRAHQILSRATSSGRRTRYESRPIGLLATFGALIATTVIGALAYWIFAMFGWHLSFLHGLFGALISPTDPIAVLACCGTANAYKPLKTTIVGESLFNNGTAVVVLTVLLGIAQRLRFCCCAAGVKCRAAPSAF